MGSTQSRRALIGLVAGVISSAVLVATLHNLPLGAALGGLSGVAYMLIIRPARFAYVESLFTAVSLSVPMWATVSIIVLPVLGGNGPQWTSAGMRALFPQLVGWTLFGAALGITAQALTDITINSLVTEPVAQAIGAAQTRIVILGGGFAGMTTAEYLEREFGADRSVTFTLVNEGNSLLFTPMLAEVAGGSLEPSHISSPLRTSLHRTDVTRARVAGLDLDGRRVLLDSRDGAVPEAISYDHLVLALGSVSNYFGNANVREHSFGFKSLLDAIRIRNHVIDMFERANREPDECARRELLTFVIAGGGFAGVELAGALNDFARGILADYPHASKEDVTVTVVHSRDAILPELSQTLGAYAKRSMEARGVHFALGRRVTDASPRSVTLDNGSIRTRTLVWTAGTIPNPLMHEAGLETGERGAVRVDSTFSVAGAPGLWALGDCAALIDSKTGKPYPPTAQFALRQGQLLARNIRAAITGTKLEHFHFDSLGALCAIGHHTACAELNLPWPVRRSVRFSGLLAWFMWRGIYLSKLPGLERKVRVLIDWATELFFPRDIVQTIDLE